ncbi:hypothetical protein D3C75_159880 [compost metagenome]
MAGVLIETAGEIPVEIVAVSRTVRVLILRLLHHKRGMSLRRLLQLSQHIEFILGKFIDPFIANLQLIIHPYAVIADRTKLQRIDVMLFTVNYLCLYELVQFIVARIPVSQAAAGPGVVDHLRSRLAGLDVRDMLFVKRIILVNILNINRLYIDQAVIIVQIQLSWHVNGCLETWHRHSIDHT